MLNPLSVLVHSLFHLLLSYIYIYIYIYEGESTSNAFFYSTGISTVTGTCIIHQKEAGPLRIASLLPNGHRFSQKQCSTFKWDHVSLPSKILLTVLWPTSSLQFSLLHHWNVCLLNPLSWSRRDDSLKALNLVSVDEVKLSTRMRWLSWCLCVVDPCHTQGGHYRLTSWV